MSKPSVKPKPDMEVLKNLYEFGGLIGYKVEYFDPISFKIVQDGEMTFDEDEAIARAESWKKRGFHARILAPMIQFDKAFSENRRKNDTRNNSGRRRSGKRPAYVRV